MEYKWRPPDWPKEPCIDCKDKEVDSYGYLCNLSCGKRTVFLSYEAGAEELLKRLFQLAKESSTGKFEIDSKIVIIQ
jgi:hypothetical protein